jgi:hypothetical protein
MALLKHSQANNKHDIIDILLENNLSLRKVLSDIEHIAEENKDTLQYRGICLSILEKIRSV